MANPWEKYAAPATEEEPWNKYAKPTQADDLSKFITPAGPGGGTVPFDNPAVVKNIAGAAVETATEFVPRSLGQVLELLTPVAAVPRNLEDAYHGIKSVIAGEEQPDTLGLQAAEKTPPFSKERFKAGFSTLAQLAMLVGGAKGLAHQVKSPLTKTVETLYPETLPPDQVLGEPASNLKPTEVPPDTTTVVGEPADTQIPRTGEAGTDSAGSKGVGSAPEQAPPTGIGANEPRPLDTVVDAAPPSEPTGLPEGFVSVGASTGADITAPKTTSTKNAVVDAERQARGLSPIAQEARQSNPATFDAAEQKLAENPDHGKNVVKGLLDGTKREVSEVDEAVLLHEKITTQNERELAATRALDENLSPEERAEAEVRYADMEAHLNAIDQATHRSGTIWGRLGQFRQRLMADDYTFVAMERKARIAKGGPLTPEESATIKKQSAELERTVRKAEAATAKADEVASVEAAEQEIKKIKARTGGKKTEPVTAEVERANILDGMKKRVAEGDKPADLRSWVQKLAENIVKAEPTLEREPFLDRLHGEVVKAVPGLSRRQTADLLSGYGDVKLLNPDATKAKLRDLKGQLQQVSKIEDMMAKQAPKKTGVERRIPSDEERRLIKQVNELKKKGGFNVTDPATQLRSALDAIKTRLRNQIADLDHQIATGTKTVKTKTGVPYDIEAQVLRQQRDALKERFDEIFGKPEMTPEQRLKLATAAAERGIADYERRIRENDFSQKTSTTPVSPELQSLRAERDALRDEYKMLESVAHPGARPQTNRAK